MIRFKEQKIREERERMLQQEKKNLEISPWGRDSKKDVLKSKKMQYLSFYMSQIRVRKVTLNAHSPPGNSKV